MKQQKFSIQDEGEEQSVAIFLFKLLHVQIENFPGEVEEEE